MRLEVKLFAAVRDRVGAAAVELDVPDPPTVGRVRAALAEQRPALAELVRLATFAVNAEYAGDDAIIPDGADVACIPPVSGG